jgi:hypothetical protein
LIELASKAKSEKRTAKSSQAEACPTEVQTAREWRILKMEVKNGFC